MRPDVAFLTHVTEVLARVRYKEGWTFRVAGEDSGRPFLQVRFKAVDEETGLLEEQSGRKWRLSPHMTNGEIVQTAFLACKQAEEHECRERFRYDDRAIFGPHIDLDALWWAADKRRQRS